MTGSLAFLFSWWLLLCAVILAFAAIRPNALRQALRILGSATFGGVLVNFVVVQFPSISLDQALQATQADSDGRLFVFMGWAAGKFLGPYLLPLLGWLLGLIIGLFWAVRHAGNTAQAAKAARLNAPAEQAWPPR